MIQTSSLTIFLIASLGLLVIPGPSVIYIITRSITQGKKAGITSVLGIELATLCHITAAAFGLSAILVTSSFIFKIVKYIGAGYLIYLGLKVILSKSDHIEKKNSEETHPLTLFRKGFIVNLLNPKTALFFYAFLPQFIDPSIGSSSLQILFLGLIFVSLATITDCTYALISSSLRMINKPNLVFKKMQKIITGLIYIILGITACTSEGSK